MSRSQSRGREFESSGRGGAGNIRPQSREPLAHGLGPEDYSASRGRELRSTSKEPITHSGRGGAGNIRSPSRDPEGERKDYEADSKLVKDYDSHQHTHSSGRGGVGNIDRSRSPDARHKTQQGSFLSSAIGSAIGRLSRDHSRESPRAASTEHHTAGRGGYGNTYDGGPPDAKIVERVEEEERGAYKSSLEEDGAHTSGRGGYGNTSSAAGTGGYDTQVPHHAANDHIHASGRGGAGNIHENGY